MDEIERVLQDENPEELKALFSFDYESNEIILKKFNLWARHYKGNYFKSEDAPFHADIDGYNLQVYLGQIITFTDIGFRGAAKTARTKLITAFFISNDLLHRRKYIKVLAEDGINSKQIVTDIYNNLIDPKVLDVYPEIFKKTKYKREETMGSFTTATGVKLLADTVGVSARGALQEDARPDLIWFEDFENKKSLKSPVVTNTIWDNMEEAKNSLSVEGGCLYNCNYISESGNVHKIVLRGDGKDNIVLITPIKKDGKPTWPAAFTMERINTIEKTADDFTGEYLCEPSAGPDIFFDRSTLDLQIELQPKRVIADFKMFFDYDPSHRYGIGCDVAGGVGLDSSTTVIVDFTTFPSRVVATFKSNTIAPNVFGDEINSQANRYGQPIIAVENNMFTETIGRLKHIEYPNLFFTEMKTVRVGIPPKMKTIGWNTNSDTKSKMLFDLKKAVVDGHFQLSDPDLKIELRSYTRNDVMDRAIDPRLTTRHFDLLMAAAIAYQMKNHAEISSTVQSIYKQPAYESPLNDNQ